MWRRIPRRRSWRSTGRFDRNVGVKDIINIDKEMLKVELIMANMMYFLIVLLGVMADF